MQDNNYKYNAGDSFPRVGYNPSDKRIEELLTDKNRRKTPMIKAVVEETKPEPIVEETEVIEDAELVNDTKEAEAEHKTKRKRKDVK